MQMVPSADPLSKLACSYRAKDVMVPSCQFKVPTSACLYMLNTLSGLIKEKVKNQRGKGPEDASARRGKKEWQAAALDMHDNP